MAKPIDTLTTCVHLRSKQMFYETAGSRDREHDAEVERLFGPCDTTVFWCQCTQTGRGPDQAVAGRSECARAGRSCFVGISSLA